MAPTVPLNPGPCFCPGDCNCHRQGAPFNRIAYCGCKQHPENKKATK